MVNLSHSLTYEIKPIPPYNFNLTVRKPAGWPLFTPLEIYEGKTLWTAVHLDNTLIGLKLSSEGTTNNPCINAKVFLESKPTDEKLDKIKKTLIHCIGADEDLGEFYAVAREDSILRYVVDDLFGMHSTASGDNVFPDALLAILLQMAPLKRSNEMMDCMIRRYGETAEFNNKTVHVWPSPQKLGNLNPQALAKECKVGYRANRIVQLSLKLMKEGFPTLQELEKFSEADAKKKSS